METVKRHGIGVVALPLLLVITACLATKAEQAEYDRQDRHNQLLDQYYTMKAYCRSNGLAVVVEQNSPERCSGKLRRANGGFCPPGPDDRVLGCQGR
jgi:hypothetical protein